MGSDLYISKLIATCRNISHEKYKLCSWYLHVLDQLTYEYPVFVLRGVKKEPRERFIMSRCGDYMQKYTVEIKYYLVVLSTGHIFKYDETRSKFLLYNNSLEGTSYINLDCATFHELLWNTGQIEGILEERDLTSLALLSMADNMISEDVTNHIINIYFNKQSMTQK